MPKTETATQERINTTTADAVKLLEDAAVLIAGDRNDAYGPADLEFERIAIGWEVIAIEALKSGGIESRHVALMMVWLKTCRELAARSRDNWADMAGYAGLGSAL